MCGEIELKRLDKSQLICAAAPPSVKVMDDQGLLFIAYLTLSSIVHDVQQVWWLPLFALIRYSWQS